MNRRTFSAAALTTALLPATALMKQQEATPHAQPPHENAPVDPRARNLTETLSAISPLALLEALEVADVTTATLIEGNDGEPPVSVPWADYGDTDLYSSLGGVILTTGSTALHDPDTEMIGGYIVYESAEIAYHEFTRRIGDLYENPSMTMSVAGTNVWILESDGFQIGTWRIGNVMMIALVSDHQGNVVEGIIDHLIDVSAGLAS